MNLKSFIQKIISYFGYYIIRKKALVPDIHLMADGLQRMHGLKIVPDIIVDIGAAQGHWTEKAIQFWPEARYEMVEPLTENEPALKALHEDFKNVHYNLGVAGEQPGELSFNVSTDLDGSGVYGVEDEHARKVRVFTVDELVKELPGMIMIKLDTHGYELPILKGAAAALTRTSLLVIEVYGFYVSPTCLLFHEVSSYLDGLGFRLVDIVDVMRRPGDEAFWQADAFYLRKDHPLFKNNSYA